MTFWRRPGSARGGAAFFVFVVLSGASGADDWSRFRGPDGSGVLEASALPAELGPEAGVRWKTALPPGHSSPILAGDRLFVTAFEDAALLTLALGVDDGQILWRREIARPRKQGLHGDNNPASPTPVTDGRAVYAFFPDFGLVAYSVEGEELWRRPLGPFRSLHGISSSPVLAGGVLVQVCDQDTGAFLVLVDTRTGEIVRRVDRFAASYSTPVVYQREDRCEIVVAGTGELAAYDCRSGDRLWWVPGLPYQPKASPLVTRVGDEDLVIFHVRSLDNLEELMPPWPQAVAKYDEDGDGRMTTADMAVMDQLDFDGNGEVTEDEYVRLKDISRAPHTLLAVHPGQRGDVSEKVLWRGSRNIPEVATPLVYGDTLFLLKNGGILTSLDPRTGEIHKQGRLTGALGTYYASPVASGGRLYAASTDGHLVVVKAAAEWDVESVADMGEPLFATPAIAGGRLYVRTPSSLYCFANDAPESAPSE